MRQASSLHSSLQALLCVVFIAGLALRNTQTAYAATYTVNSLADPGDGTCDASCTLRDAIIAANAHATADTIQFSLSGTITLASVLPGVPVSDVLTIDGAGRAIHINGNEHDRILWTNTNSKLTLKHLIIEDGYTLVSGGGIYSLGYLTIDDCTLAHNRADDHGGAIYSNGTLTVTNSILSNNSTDIGNGGAIYVYTSTVATIIDSEFQNNYSNDSGGAIYNNSDLTIKDTNFSLNTAGFGNGGAVYSKISIGLGDVTIDRSSFSENMANYGGGYYNYSGGFVFRNTSFTSNQARIDGGGMGLLHDHPTSYILDSSFKSNTALSNGGGFANYYGVNYLFDGVLFQNNHADQDGGAIYNSTGHAYLHHTTFKSNSAGRDGGGLYNLEHLSIHHSSFSGNQADQNGGAVYHGSGAIGSGIDNSTFYKNIADRGGGIYSLDVLNVLNCTLSANNAETTGGAVYGDLDTFFTNSILANSPNGGNCDNEGNKPVDSGNNIDSAATCGWGTTHGSMNNTNPMLGTLQLNGGTTNTMALRAGSPAIDAVVWNAPNSCPGDDQRGYLRPFGTHCDIGAFERYFRLFMPLVRK